MEDLLPLGLARRLWMGEEGEMALLALLMLSV